jgi:hypothetical protein
MGEVVQFSTKQTAKPIISIPASFWDSYKDLLRKYYEPHQVERIVAAILDQEIYYTTEDWVREAADLYYKHAPEKSR